MPTLTCVEIDPASVRRLRAEFDGRVDVVGDGAALPFPGGRFSAVVCFTMPHHVPSPQQQNALFTEAARVLRPGGVFAGLDSQPSLRGSGSCTSATRWWYSTPRCSPIAWNAPGSPTRR